MSAESNTAEKGRAGLRRQIKLPMSKAIEIAFKSIKIRFWRSVITAAGIFLGIAFFTSVRMSGEFSMIQRKVIEAKRDAIAAGTLKPTPNDIRQVNSLATDQADAKAAEMRLKWLSIMALIVCTVGIANSMLMSVTERYKEIGTMKCLGALDGLVVKLFFIEASFLGFFSSVIGFVLGWLVISLIRLATDGVEVFGLAFWIASVKLLGLSVLVGTVLTFIATILPAMRAAQMPPAAALRVEI
ncbi:MAG: FtsX-like permease family protein [Chthonomonadales bacterium]|nr:FtsX-like permease family protein [Chthonomonadales bacterium]